MYIQVIMTFFSELVAAFRRIEDSGICVVDGMEYAVNIKTVVVADMSFLWKYCGRGNACGNGSFCWLCKCHAKTRHLGYPGGCRTCRDAGEAYNDHGEQSCRHWEAHTPEFEKWESARFNYLEEEVGGTIPLSSLPSWNDVQQLREECDARCTGENDRKVLKKAKTEEQLERFLLARCRGGSKLTSNKLQGARHCDVKIVRKDLEERNMLQRNMNEGEMRATMEVRLRLEDEWKRLRIIRKDTRFLNGGDGGVQNELDRILVDLLHAPMRMNEKVPPLPSKPKWRVTGGLKKH
jgi:hypothetical protein